MKPDQPDTTATGKYQGQLFPVLGFSLRYLETAQKMVLTLDTSDRLKVVHHPDFTLQSENVDLSQLDVGPEEGELVPGLQAEELVGGTDHPEGQDGHGDVLR